MGFASSGFAQFISGPAGRIIRIAAGIALIVAGIFWIGDVAGWIVAVIGLVPLVAGLFDFCILAPLFGGPLAGKEIRRQGAKTK